MPNFSENLQFTISEKKLDPEKRIVVAGVLEGDFLSANKRFYPEAVVRKVSETLVGKPSLIGHDTDSPRDIVARVVEAGMSGKKLFASFKFGTDSTSDEMFTKVKEGLVDSYSIRAFGESKIGKIDGEEVDIVQSMQMESIDLVVHGGISSAKVLKVYESAPKIEFNKENEMTEDQKKQFDEALLIAKTLKEANDLLIADKKKSEDALAEITKKAHESEIASHKQSKLSSIKDEKVRGLVEKLLTGETKETIDAQFETHKALIESLGKSDFIIAPVDGKKIEKNHTNISSVLESSDVTNEEKLAILKKLVG